MTPANCTKRDVEANHVPIFHTLTNGESSMYEITFVDTGKTIRLTAQQAAKQFGKAEWREIKANFLPHIVVVDCTEYGGSH
jgi:hypothetical protein